MHRTRSYLGAALFLMGLTPVLVAPPAAAQTVYKTRTNIQTTPAGADVFLVTPTAEEPLGQTPLDKVRLPRGAIKLKFTKAGYDPLVKNLEIGNYTQTYIFELVKSIAPGTLDFTSGPAYTGAKVVIDGRQIGTLPAKVDVTPGRHQAVITMAGFQRWERWIEVSENQVRTFEIVLVQAERPKGTLLITSIPTGADIRIDGAPRGITPAVLNEVEAGTHVVELRLTGHDVWSQTLDVVAGRQAGVEANLTRTGGDTGALRIVADVEAAEITIDGKAVGIAPITVPGLSAGAHVVEASSVGLSSVRREVTVDAGGSKLVNIELKPATAAAKSTLEVAADVVGATVSVDGGKPVPAPVTIDTLPPGEYLVQVKAKGHAIFEQRVTLKPGAKEKLVAKMSPLWRLEVKLHDGSEAQVFADGVLVGKTPLVREGVGNSSEEIVVKRADGTSESFTHDSVAGKSVELVAFTPRALRRAMPFSAQTVGKGNGAIDGYLDWPFIFSVRLAGGITDDVEIGLAVRSALFLMNEFELRGKWTFSQTKTFSAGVDFGAGYGVGSDERDSIFIRPSLLGSMRITDSAAVTLSMSPSLFFDKLKPIEDPATLAMTSPDRRVDFQLLLGVTVEFKVYKDLNGFVRVVGDPIGTGRKLYEEDDWVGDAGIYPSLGVSWVF